MFPMFGEGFAFVSAKIKAPAFNIIFEYASKYPTLNKDMPKLALCHRLQDDMFRQEKAN